MRCLPPRHFRTAEIVDWVRSSRSEPSFVKHSRLRGKKAEGVRYENKAQKHFQQLYGDFYVPSPWFIFGEVGGGKRWCQPDGLLFMPYTGKIVIIEYKLQHTSDAWWQLKWLYLPVIRKAFPPDRWTYALCEVVKWFDPAIAFPEKLNKLANPADAQPKEISVHIWRA